MSSILDPIGSHPPTADIFAECRSAASNAARVAHNWIRLVVVAVFVCMLVISATFAEEPSASALSRSEQLDALVKEKKYLELLTVLNSPIGIKTNDYEFFEGVLANRTNHLDTSIRLLRQAIPLLHKQGARDREQIALETLADGYSRLYHYAEAADTYLTLEQRLGNQMSPQERSDIQSEALQWRLLRHVRPQSASIDAAFIVAGKRNPLGVLEAPVLIKSETRYWVVDTGANISAISRSEARRLGLQPLRGSTALKGASGIRVPINVAVAPELHIGKAKLRNVVFALLDDQGFTGEATPLSNRRDHRVSPF